MRIGLVRRGFSQTGGAEAYLLRLAGALQEAGHVPVLVGSADWPVGSWPNDQILRLAGGTPGEFAAAFSAERTGCDVHLSLERVPGCEVFRAGDGVHAAWLRRRKAFEPVWRRLGRALNPKHRELLRLEAGVFDPARTRRIIANSRLVRDEIVAEFGYPSDRIHVVYNGISPAVQPAERTSSRERLGVRDGELCLLFLGSGWDRKGLRVAIRAVEMTEDAVLVVAGRGPADAYRSPRAKFLGPTRDLGVVFGAADVMVLPTYYDPFSNACLEALAAGLPVITTPANGFSEILESGVHGGIVAEGDALGLAEEIEAWRGSDRRESTRAARISRAGEFSIARNAGETLRVLEAVLQGT